MNQRGISSVNSPFLSNEEAAAFLKLSPRALEKLRVVGGGPPFRKFGRRVLYRMDELEDWAAKRKCDSMSDPAWRGYDERLHLAEIQL